MKNIVRSLVVVSSFATLAACTLDAPQPFAESDRPAAPATTTGTGTPAATDPMAPAPTPSAGMAIVRVIHASADAPRGRRLREGLATSRSSPASRTARRPAGSRCPRPRTSSSSAPRPRSRPTRSRTRPARSPSRRARRSAPSPRASSARRTATRRSASCRSSRASAGRRSAARASASSTPARTRRASTSTSATTTRSKPEVSGLARFADTGAEGVALPAGKALAVGIAVGGARVTAFTTPKLPDGANVLVIATGLLGKLARERDGFALLAVGPNGSIGFVKQDPRVYALHASPDAPRVDAFVGNAEIVDNLGFGELSKPIQVQPGSYTIDFFAHAAGSDAPRERARGRRRARRLARGGRALPRRSRRASSRATARRRSASRPTARASRSTPARRSSARSTPRPTRPRSTSASPATTKIDPVLFAGLAFTKASADEGLGASAGSPPDRRHAGRAQLDARGALHGPGDERRSARSSSRAAPSTPQLGAELPPPRRRHRGVAVDGRHGSAALMPELRDDSSAALDFLGFMLADVTDPPTTSAVLRAPPPPPYRRRRPQRDPRVHRAVRRPGVVARAAGRAERRRGCRAGDLPRPLEERSAIRREQRLRDHVRRDHRPPAARRPPAPARAPSRDRVARRRIGARLASVLSTSVPPEMGAEAALAARALDQLRPEQRQVLILTTCHGLSHEEVAASTGHAARHRQGARAARPHPRSRGAGRATDRRYDGGCAMTAPNAIASSSSSPIARWSGWRARADRARRAARPGPGRRRRGVRQGRCRRSPWRRSATLEPMPAGLAERLEQAALAVDGCAVASRVRLREDARARQARSAAGARRRSTRSQRPLDRVRARADDFKKTQAMDDRAPRGRDPTPASAAAPRPAFRTCFPLSSAPARARARPRGRPDLHVAFQRRPVSPAARRAPSRVARDQRLDRRRRVSPARDRRLRAALSPSARRLAPGSHAHADDRYVRRGSDADPNDRRVDLAAELREKLLAAAGTARAEWTPTKDPLGKAATGEVVWNKDQQKGTMRFHGLAKNDPTARPVPALDLRQDARRQVPRRRRRLRRRLRDRRRHRADPRDPAGERARRSSRSRSRSPAASSCRSASASS